jgi:hypothetical protein
MVKTEFQFFFFSLKQKLTKIFEKEGYFLCVKKDSGKLSQGLAY